MTEKKPASGAAIAGAGAVTGGVGLLSGGVPGAKSDFTRAANLKPIDTSRGKIRGAVNGARQFAPAAAKGAPGGILDFRVSAHKGGLYGFDQAAKEAEKAGKAASHKEAFYRGHMAGKVPAEYKIIREMSRGRKLAHGALAGGAAATVYGVKRAKGEKVFSKAKSHEDTYNGALAGTGAAGALVSHSGGKILGRQEKKWAGVAGRNVDEAQKLVPGLGGRAGKKMSQRQMHKFKVKNGYHPDTPFDRVNWPKTMYPAVRDGEAGRNPKILRGASRENVARAGHLRGEAAQARHFAEVYHNTGKVVRSFRKPSLIVAGAGAGGLAAAKAKDELNKSAFGVSHG